MGSYEMQLNLLTGPTSRSSVNVCLSCYNSPFSLWRPCLTSKCGLDQVMFTHNKLPTCYQIEDEQHPFQLLVKDNTNGEVVTMDCNLLDTVTIQVCVGKEEVLH